MFTKIIHAVLRFPHTLTRKRPIESDAAHLEQVGHVLAALAVFDQLPGVVDLLPG